MYHLSDEDFTDYFMTEKECKAWVDRYKLDIFIWKMFAHEMVEVASTVGKGIIDIIRAIDPTIGVRVILYDTNNTNKEEMRQQLFDNFDEWWDVK